MIGEIIENIVISTVELRLLALVVGCVVEGREVYKEFERDIFA